LGEFAVKRERMGLVQLAARREIGATLATAGLCDGCGNPCMSGEEENPLTRSEPETARPGGTEWLMREATHGRQACAEARSDRESP
jgi:hypothetical protein